MKKIIIISMFLITMISTTYAKEWFNGGTLHSSTVRIWRVSEYENKLATVSDWLAVTTWKGHLNS